MATSSAPHATPPALPTIPSPSAETLSRREAVARFLWKSFSIWEELPSSETGQIATQAVQQDTITCATAFNVGRHGGPDVICLKKDITREGISRDEVGYWRADAGPAPRWEQRILVRIGRLTQNIMNYIQETYDFEYMAFYLYAWIDLWCIVTKHWILWIACVFLCGYLCLVRPIVIVGESSKLYRLFLEWFPDQIFGEGYNPADFENFLNGNFNLALLRLLFIVVTPNHTTWKELPLTGHDYLHAIGLPVVVQYGPTPAHTAIYIPKFHPYRHYHSLSIVEEIVDLDNACRIMQDLAARVVSEHPAIIPSDNSRRDILVKLRLQIEALAVKSGVWEELRKCKADLQLVQDGFLGPKNKKAASAVTPEERTRRALQTAAT